MKGAAQATHTYPNGTKTSYIVDVNDLLQPPLMENALFITTGMVTNKEVRNTTCADTGGLVDNEPYALCANPLPAWKDVKIHNCTEKKGTYVRSSIILPQTRILRKHHTGTLQKRRYVHWKLCSPHGRDR